MVEIIASIVATILLVVLVTLWRLGQRSGACEPSTRAIMREGGWRGILSTKTLNSYIYARWSDAYVRLGKWVLPHLGPRMKRWLANHYHGKVLTLELARAIVTVDHDIPLRDLEQIIPYDAARDLVLTGPPEIAVHECACRQSSPHPCQPTQVCMVVGQPFVDFILEHHPTSSRRLTQEEALALLEAEHERGHVHSAWFKDASMGRFYTICNCCRCCCGGIEAMLDHGVPVVASSGYVAEVDSMRCISCGSCAESCPFGAIVMNGRGAEVAWSGCMGCGICVNQCHEDAITLLRDERKGIPLDVRLLVEETLATQLQQPAAES